MDPDLSTPATWAHPSSQRERADRVAAPVRARGAALQGGDGSQQRRLPFETKTRNSSLLPARCWADNARRAGERLEASPGDWCGPVRGGWGGIENLSTVKRFDALWPRFRRSRQNGGAVIRARIATNTGANCGLRDVVGGGYRASATAARGRAGQRRDGANTTVTYLGSDPGASWIGGHAPSVRPRWPAFAIPGGALIVVAILLQVIRLQRDLLSYGRGTSAVVTKAVKKRSDEGSYWRVEYKWRLMSGAIRKGRYSHTSKHPPVVGSIIPIVRPRSTSEIAIIGLVAVRS